MVIRSAMKLWATAAASVAAGWALHAALATPTAAANLLPSALPAQAAPSGRAVQTANAAPLIVVSSDGNVTLRVEQQPLEWVLEQIARQSGWSDVKVRAGTIAAASGPGLEMAAAAECPEVLVRTPAQMEATLKALQHGSDTERYQGLLQAREDGVTVPDELLKSMVESDASEDVRLVALDAYLEARSGDNDALRSALQAALYVPNGAIQREAKKRLDELTDSERVADASLQQASD